MRKGYTLAELLIVMAIVMVLAVISLVSFVGRRNRSQLITTVDIATGMLREAQSRSMNQSDDKAWGVHFENATSGPAFIALFSGTYGTSSIASYQALPTWVSYVTSSVAYGSYAEIRFSQLSGAASGSSSVAFYLAQSPSVSTTISVASSGAVIHD